MHRSPRIRGASDYGVDRLAENFSLPESLTVAHPVHRQIPNTVDVTVKTFLLLHCVGASVLRCFGASVLRCFGASVLRCFGASVLRCFGASVLRCFDSILRPFWLICAFLT